jgi:hypothetical protein
MLQWNANHGFVLVVVQDSKNSLFLEKRLRRAFPACRLAKFQNGDPPWNRAMNGKTKGACNFPGVKPKAKSDKG